WSPNGKRVAFLSNRDVTGKDDATNPGGVFNIWLMNEDGSSPTPLTKLMMANLFFDSAVWSPDGSRIAYASNRNVKLDSDNLNDNNTTNIFVVKTDGSGDTTVLTNL